MGTRYPKCCRKRQNIKGGCVLLMEICGEAWEQSFPRDVLESLRKETGFNKRTKTRIVPSIRPASSISFHVFVIFICFPQAHTCEELVVGTGVVTPKLNVRQLWALYSSREDNEHEEEK